MNSGRLHTLLRWQQFDEFPQFTAHEAPAALYMLDQTVRFVLGDNTHFANAGVDAIGQWEIDNPEFAAKRDSRFGAPLRQLMQA